MPVPGTIYSTIGLDGVLSANYKVEPGTVEADGSSASWGTTNIELSTDHQTESYFIDGVIESLDVSDAGDTLRLGKTSFSGIQRPGRFELSVGNFEISATSVAVEEAGIETYRLGPVAFSGMSEIDGERVDGDFRMSLDALEIPGYGESDFDLAMRFTGMDGLSLVCRTSRRARVPVPRSRSLRFSGFRSGSSARSWRGPGASCSGRTWSTARSPS